MNIKKELIMGLFLSLLSIFGIIFTLYNSPNLNDSLNLSKNDKAIVSPNLKLTIREVSLHNTPDDCWVIINNSVYNLSGFSSAHPGGSSSIEFSCGKDATLGFMTKGENEPHSSRAQKELETFKIGDLNE